MSEVQFKNGLVPAIVRDARNGAILTLAYMNDQALQKTRETGETWFWSRSRQKLWNKGSTSGNRQKVVHIATDCDADALVISVIPSGPACHSGKASCFDDVPSPALNLEALTEVLRKRFAERPENSYSAYLFKAGRDKILKKIGEEATEVVIAGKGGNNERVAEEMADLLYHLSVLLVDAGMDWDEVGEQLKRRSKAGAQTKD
jgi:phosphoribosyl-AMP cyclohydrolase / phosphoribosyl-ATP pyrophosphohydrolase